MELTIDNKFGAVKITAGDKETITKVVRKTSETGATEILYEATEGIKTFIDYSCDLGLSYTYLVNGATVKSNVKVDYEDIILFDNSIDGGAQLIRFNPNLSALKKNQAETVTQTLGSKYPIVRKNGDVDYYTFTLGGMISTLALKEQYSTTNRTLEERNFRNEFVKTLSNGRIKLFKSGPEGLMLVRVTGVSLTPEPKLGRDIYSFSATVTEIAEATIDNLKKLNMFTPANKYFTAKLDKANNVYFIVKE